MNAAVRDMNAAVRRSYVDPCRGRGLLFQASACEGGILYAERTQLLLGSVPSSIRCSTQFPYCHIVPVLSPTADVRLSVYLLGCSSYNL